jgi:hypothetical protein
LEKQRKDYENQKISSDKMTLEVINQNQKISRFFVFVFKRFLKVSSMLFVFVVTCTFIVSKRLFIGQLLETSFSSVGFWK